MIVPVIIDNFTNDLKRLMHTFELLLENDRTHFAVTASAKLKELDSLDLKKIPFKNSLPVLKQLAALGRITFKGKPLIVDLFSRVAFAYSVDMDSAGLKLNSGLDLSVCQFIAPSNPVWLIRNQRLQVLGDEISWTELQKLPRLITAKELAELQTDAKAGFPEVRLNFSSAAAPEPLPVLLLTDGKGGFANLAMDYGTGNLTPFDPQGTKTLEQHWEKDLIEAGFERKQVLNAAYYCPLDKVSKIIPFLLEMGWKILDSRGRTVVQETARTLESAKEGQAMTISGRLQFGKSCADLNQLAQGLKKRERFLELSNNEVGFLKDNDPWQGLLEEVVISNNSLTLKPEKLGLLIEEKQAALPFLQLLQNLTPVEKLSLQMPFNGQLRPYQQTGVDWLNTLYQSGLSGILADEMGLGKTVQVLAFLAHRSPTARHLIVLPTSLLFNWEKELQRFLPAMPFKTHHGTLRTQLLETGIVLTTYNTLRSDSALFNEHEWDCLILDEAQAVKNPDTLAAQAVTRLKSRFRLSMTGTIIENHPKELWSHFHFILPGLLENRAVFEQRLQVSASDPQAIQKVQKVTRPFILRRKKEEVAKDLPPLQEQIIYVDMTEEQQAAYQQFLTATKHGLIQKIAADGEKKHRLEILEALLRLRQIACHPLLAASYLQAPVTSSAKLDQLLSDLEEIREEGKKALIFSQFASMLHLIAKELKTRGIPFSLLEGATQNREKEVAKFQEDPDTSFFLITLKAGGVGLNLTAADYVLLYDPWWNEAAEAQAISRAHRIGQKNPVIAKRYVAAHTVEEKMIDLKNAKKALFDGLLDGDLSMPDLNRDDLSRLLAQDE